MPNFRMTLSYDGTRYNGWQRQGNTPDTIQGRLEAALSDLLAQPVEVAGSGRTDAGVHARMQTASFRAKTDLPAPELLRQLRARLPGDIGVLTLEETAPRFHARLSCRGKTYVYRVWNSETPNVFERRYVCALPQPLDTAAMQHAAALLCGTHDYTSFCANRRMKKSAVRTVDAITVERRGEEVRLTFSGDGFLYHMVRILTGTLLEVGLGQRDADTMPAILAAHDRSAAGATAPARGLILWETRYAHTPRSRRGETRMKEECLICGAPLEYLETDVQMQCEICRKKELAKTRCVNGHYVCSDCHMQGLDSIVELCLRETACDPIAIVERMMALPSCHMHGPEHHVMVGAALLTAYHNAGGDIDLSDALMEMLRRGKSVPGGACGFWGACGAGISTGMFVSIISRSTPLTDEPFALSHKMTAAALGQIGEIGGPRCCKRDSFLSILTAIDFVKEHFGIALQKPEIVCRYAAQNNQCIGKRCPFSAANH